ncbi:hypothetical protein P8C59_006307 [Phyllachora maydis]|uniref:SART-1 n=1 Tax=Phyllachora maydis TaxID=1825666 RepID=A0AAD9I7Y4_9PEZI|nr:hypothetical protein P8C59_006307 [Phyllachora maydis]
MGMKPLPVPGARDCPRPSESESEDEEPASTLESREAQGYENFKRVQEERDAKKRREKRAAEIKKARDREQRDAKLRGKGLADDDDNDVASDTRSWLKNQKGRQAQLEKTRKAEEERAAKLTQAAAEAAEDGIGTDVQIGHDISSFLDGAEQILTLKDTGVLDEEEGDELEALALREEEKLQERIDRKKKKPIYDPTEDTEQSLLAQYDEVIDGKKKKKAGFKLGSIAAVKDDLSDILAGPAQKRKREAGDLGDLDDAPAPTSDYMDIPIKKLKKKKKATRRKAADDDDTLLPGQDAGRVEAEKMDIDPAPVGSKRRKKISDEDYVDDDDLQSSLNLQRKAALKKRKPEEIVKEAAELAAQEDRAGDLAGGLVIDEITGFVDLLGDRERHSQPTKKARSVSHLETKAAEDGHVDEDEQMRDSHTDVRDQAADLVDGVAATGVQDEKTFRRRETFMAELGRQMAIFDEEAKKQRERDRQSGRLDRMSAREKEAWQQQQNSARDRHQALILERLYKEGYQPNVELKYVDDHGRRLDTKSAWRHLSHAFHGRSSGAKKTDKQLQKIEAEKRREAESILDASQNVGLRSAASHQTKKRKEAGVRLA